MLDQELRLWFKAILLTLDAQLAKSSPSGSQLSFDLITERKKVIEDLEDIKNGRELG